MHPCPNLSDLVYTIELTSQIVTLPSCIPPATIPISPARGLHAILVKLAGDFAVNTEISLKLPSSFIVLCIVRTGTSAFIDPTAYFQ